MTDSKAIRNTGSLSRAWKAIITTFYYFRNEKVRLRRKKNKNQKTLINIVDNIHTAARRGARYRIDRARVLVWAKYSARMCCTFLFWLTQFYGLLTYIYYSIGVTTFIRSTVFNAFCRVNQLLCFFSNETTRWMNTEIDKFFSHNLQFDRHLRGVENNIT